MYYNPVTKEFTSLGKISNLYGVLSTEENANKLGFFKYVTSDVDESFFDRQTIIISDNKAYGIYTPNSKLSSLLPFLSDIESHLVVPLANAESRVSAIEADEIIDDSTSSALLTLIAQINARLTTIETRDV